MGLLIDAAWFFCQGWLASACRRPASVGLLVDAAWHLLQGIVGLRLSEASLRGPPGRRRAVFFCKGRFASACRRPAFVRLLSRRYSGDDSARGASAGKSKKQSVKFDSHLSDSDRGRSTLDGLTFPVVQMIAARAHARGSVRGGPLAVVRAERDSPASHRACFRGPRRAELAAPLGPALQAAVAEHSSAVGRRASARARAADSISRQQGTAIRRSRPVVPEAGGRSETLI